MATARFKTPAELQLEDAHMTNLEKQPSGTAEGISHRDPLTLDKMREIMAGPVKGICQDCALEPKVPGKHKCPECALRKLTMSEQQVAAVERITDNADVPRPKNADLKTDRRKWCNQCHTMRLTDTPSASFDMIPTAARCRACSGLKTREGKYGGTAEQHAALATASDGRCMICGCKTHTRPLAVDHRHSDDTVRGLLCSSGGQSCNEMIGYWQDDPKRFLATAMYLLRPPAGAVFDTANYVSNRELGAEIIKLMKEILSGVDEL